MRSSGSDGQASRRAVGAGEGRGVDFKVDASSPKNIVKDFVAFSNSAGGWIPIGVEDDRNVVGLDDPQDIEEAIAKAIYDLTEPQQSPMISVLTQDEMEVVLVQPSISREPSR